MKKINVMSTITFVGLCSVLAGCGVAMSGNGGAVGNSTSQNASNLTNVAPATSSVDVGMLAVNQELIVVVDKKDILGLTSSSIHSSHATTKVTLNSVPVVDKGKGTSKVSATSSNVHHTVSTGVSSSKKTSSSSYQGMSVAEQNKLVAQAQAQALANIEYRDTHNPKYDGQDYSKGIFGHYVGTKIQNVTSIENKTIRIQSGQSVHVNFSNSGNDTYSVSGGNQ